MSAVSAPLRLSRIVWVNPTNIADTLTARRRNRPDLNPEVLDPHTFCALFKKFRKRQAKPNRP